MGSIPTGPTVCPESSGTVLIDDIVFVRPDVALAPEAAVTGDVAAADYASRGMRVGGADRKCDHGHEPPTRRDIP